SDAPVQNIYYYHHFAYGSFVFVNNPLIAGEDWSMITGKWRRLIDMKYKMWNAIYRERACAKKTCLTAVALGLRWGPTYDQRRFLFRPIPIG
ncbi:Uncharacterized protein FWK35_00014112, partial [Aphis craccivora]